MDVRDKIKVLDGGATPNVTADAVRRLRAELPVLMEHMAMMAELQKAKFDALKRNGFSDDHALELCKSVF